MQNEKFQKLKRIKNQKRFKLLLFIKNTMLYYDLTIKYDKIQMLELALYEYANLID